MADAKSKGNPQYVIGKTDDINKFYTLGKQMGLPGQFGYALKATHKSTGEIRAIKVISKARFARSSDKEFHFAQLRAEIETMKRLDHPNIIKYYECFETEVELYIVMELCQGGELFDRIKTLGTYSEAEASAALRQIFAGIAYMHSQNPKIAHCDLKPDNFLYTSHDQDAKIKIIDFGMAKFVRARHHFKSLCGTPYYMAPEVIMGQYNEHADLWSLGVVMFVMLFGYPPFYADQEKYGRHTDEAIFELIKQGFKAKTMEGYGPHFPQAIPVSESAKDILSKLLTRDVAKRYTAAEALDHPWLRGETALKTPINDVALKNLKNFSASTKLKQAVLNMMSDSLPESEIRQMKATFTAMDENGDGVITIDELKHALAKMGDKLSQAEVETMFKLADVDGSGSISYKELLLTAVQRKLLAKEERLWDTFRRLDLDGDGFVSSEEIVKVLGAENAAELVAEADTNKDGFISIDEFVAMWGNKQSALSQQHH